MNLPTRLKTYLIPLLTFTTTLTSLAQSPPPKVGSFDYKLKAASTIDKYVESELTRLKLPLPKQVNEAKFARRSYLVLAGRIPTLEEVQSFVGMQDDYKRETLVEDLLGSKGYISHTTNYYYDLLRAKERFNNNRSAAPYLAWIRKSVAENKPWDKFSKELLGAKGSIWNNGAVGYYTRDKGMQLDNLSNTTRLFAGTRMECAQCHDHPYNEKIDRMDFYRLAAFSNGFREANAPAFKALRKQLSDQNKDRTDFGRFVRYVGDNVVYSSRQGLGVGRIKLPNDYQYNDGDPHEMVGARTPFEKRVRMSDRKDGDDGIERFTKWLTKDNKRFTSVIVNRMWNRVMGGGLYTPVDAYVPAEQTSNPALIKFLCKLMIDLKYDLKEFQHVLLLTKTFSYETSQKLSKESYAAYGGRPLSRLTAEQIWDSFITLKSGNPDSLATRKLPNTLTYRGKAIGGSSSNMATISSTILNSKDPKKLYQYLTQLHQSVSKGSQKSGNQMMIKHDTSTPLRGLYRASELSSPAPLNHLLREFGQSDRELIQNSSSEANVNQVLSMLNGHVEKLLVNDPKAQIYKAILKEENIEENIIRLFLSTLSREPTEPELRIFKNEIVQRGDKGYKNILSALLTSREFLFVQ